MMRARNKDHATFVLADVLQWHPEREFIVSEAGLAVRLILMPRSSLADKRGLQESKVKNQHRIRR